MEATILVVDDQERLRKFVRAVLVKRGYAVLQASDGNEARQIAAQNTVDLLITDLVMPGISGIELTEQLYACGRITRHLIISGFAAPHAVAAPGARGAFLKKPFSPEDLVRTVESLLTEALT
jgi:two-component system, cell cycle sensor histidine kinase and response regulator CckA